jgi:predicted ribosomally synthesized peptide with SipW-like signal peptide
LLLVAALATGVLSTVAGRGTVAYFTTQVQSTPNTFTAGTLRLEIADVDDAMSVNPVTASISFDNMKPGDTVYAPLEINNTGTLDLRYGIKYTTSTSGDQDLADALFLAVKGTTPGGTGTKATVAGDAAHACSAANWGTAAVWSSTVHASAVMDSAGETLVAPSSGAGGTGRDLAADTGKETLCFQITWPSPGADNTFNNPVDGQTNTTITFTFDGLVAADAVTNNP